MDQSILLTYIITSVTINSLAQIVYKKGLKGAFKKVTIKEIIKTMLKPVIMIGLAMYAFSALLWILVLSNTDVSYAYPFLSLGYVLVAFLGYFMLNEKITKKRIIGISVIIIGVLIVGYSL